MVDICDYNQRLSLGKHWISCPQRSHITIPNSRYLNAISSTNFLVNLRVDADRWQHVHSVAATKQCVELRFLGAARTDASVTGFDWLRLLEGDTQGLRSHGRGSLLHHRIPATHADHNNWTLASCQYQACDNSQWLDTDNLYTNTKY